MAYPIITIEFKTNLLTQQPELKIDHNNVEGGWVTVAQLLVKAQEAVLIQAFAQLTAQPPYITLAGQVPPGLH